VAVHERHRGRTWDAVDCSHSVAEGGTKSQVPEAILDALRMCCMHAHLDCDLLVTSPGDALDKDTHVEVGT
jgi:hypothetical protein